MANIIEKIRVGQYDKHLDYIIETCRKRQTNRIYELEVGAKVKFNPATRPEYLRGAQATIVEWRRSRVLIQLEDGPIGRFRGGKIIAYPASLIPVED